MGKIKRPRNKLHIPAEEKPHLNTTNPPEFNSNINITSKNLFEGINIDVRNLNKFKNDEVQSVKSFKSVKSELGADKALSKKEKLKLKKDLLLRKIDTVNQLKKEAELRRKRKNVPIIGDTNPLRDALPDLESLLKHKGDKEVKRENAIKKKAIAKEKKRKKNMGIYMQIYKDLMKNKEFQKDPMGAISDHVKAVVENKQL